MLKKDFKKCHVSVSRGYAYTVTIDVYGDELGKTLARIEPRQLETFLERRLRGGLFEFGDKGRKYQKLVLK